MSVEAHALERSKLEQKDRGELAAIVEAMGGKAPSRAKKADLVDQILTLAGVAPDSGGDTAAATRDAPAAPEPARGETARNGGRRAKATAAAAPAAPKTSEAPDAGTTEAATAEPTAVGTDVAAAAGAESAGEQARPRDTQRSRGAASESRAPRTAERNDRNERGGQSGGQQGGQAGGGNASQQGRNGGQQGGGQQQGGSQQSGGQQGGGQQGGGQQGGGQQGEGADGEPGNRRRRRRGRDRGGRAPEPQVIATDEAFVGEPVDVEGLLDLREEGYGFLRLKGYLPSKDDVYVSVKQVRQFGLRRGDFIKGSSRPASRTEKNPALLRIDSVNDKDPEQARVRRHFEDLTPLFPDEKLSLEVADDPTNMTARIIDLISPIGKGQRGLIVSPPKAGKTTIMKQIARSIELNNPEVHLIVLLVDERPEEVTDMKRWLLRGEVVASTFDRPSEEHTQVAELTIERAKRLVEEGQDVAIVLDGITRLARAYNLAAPASGRIMSGGIDAGALYPPKKFFGAARNIDEGGSLTILATALVETGSRMDEHIFEEFKGTGNMELRLDRRLAERRIYPAIDVDASSTRHEELLFTRNQLQQAWKLRRVLQGLGSGEGGSGGAGLELLIDRMKTFKSNEEFLAQVAKAPSIAG